MARVALVRWHWIPLIALYLESLVALATRHSKRPLSPVLPVGPMAQHGKLRPEVAPVSVAPAPLSIWVLECACGTSITGNICDTYLSYSMARWLGVPPKLMMS